MSNITFFSVDPTSILADIIEKFQELSGTEISQGSPEYCFASVLAYIRTLHLNELNSLGNALLLDNSTAPTIDYLAALVGVTRISASYASVTLKFILSSTHPQITIPQGTRVSSADGAAIFDTIEDVVANEDATIVTVTAKCETGGASYNNYEIGSLSALLDAVGYVNSVTNTTTPSGGTDEENDQELIARVKKAPSAFSCAGPSSAYEFYAKKVSSDIIDVKVLTHEDKSTIPVGEVWVYSLLSGGNQPTIAINDLINEELNKEDVRPITDIVRVKTPAQIGYTLVVNVVKNPGDASSLTADINNAILAYTNSRKLGLGLDVVKSKIVAACMGVDMVYSTEAILNSPGTKESDQLTIKSIPTYSGNIDITLNGVKYTIPVYAGQTEIDILTVNGTPSADGNVKVTLDGVDTLIPVETAHAEVDLLEVNGIPSIDGIIGVSLGGIPNNISVYAGKKEIDTLTIGGACTADTIITISLGGVSMFATTIQNGTSISDIVTLIASQTYTGWTAHESGVSNTIIFTKNDNGACAAPIFSANPNGITGSFSVTQAGVNTDTKNSIAARIAAQTYSGWTALANGAIVAFTKLTTGPTTAPAFAANSTGVTASFTQSIIGKNADTAIKIATNIAAQIYTGWSTLRVSNVVTFTKNSLGTVIAPAFAANSTGVTASFTQSQVGHDQDTKNSIASRVALVDFDGWISAVNNDSVAITKEDMEECIDPIFGSNNTGVEADLQRISQGYSPISNGNLSLDNSQFGLMTAIEINIIGTNE